MFHSPDAPDPVNPRAKNRGSAMSARAAGGAPVDSWNAARSAQNTAAPAPALYRRLLSAPSIFVRLLVAASRNACAASGLFSNSANSPAVTSSWKIPHLRRLPEPALYMVLNWSATGFNSANSVTSSWKIERLPEPALYTVLTRSATGSAESEDSDADARTTVVAPRRPTRVSPRRPMRDLNDDVGTDRFVDVVTVLARSRADGVPVAAAAATDGRAAV
mmetsp:Transcript_37976/g.60883  ORF Transcript_37976/g.60883 Transcript_37976/m.60883 type:complete len:219 (-) Transcript_37976:84-740(-)